MAYQSREDNDSTHRLYNPYQDLCPKYLFQEESLAQRRSWGENLTYYNGIGYLAGSSVGAARGFVSGMKSTEKADTIKLRIIRILNESDHAGRQVGNRCGVIGLMYAALESGMVAMRDKDDVIIAFEKGVLKTDFIESDE